MNAHTSSIRYNSGMPIPDALPTVLVTEGSDPTPLQWLRDNVLLLIQLRG